MISDEQYERLMGKAHQPKNLLQFAGDLIAANDGNFSVMRGLYV